MTPDEWAKIDRIHQAALERAERDRAAYLDEACAGDASLRREVESLLAYATAAEAFLDQPALQKAASELETHDPIAADVVPAVPGYSVLQVLGAGGMGVVYLAEQDPPLRRRVALKLIRPGLDSKSALARFEAERRALALMDHPNIAAVFGTGVAADGRPFVAMEFVEGVPITEYCDRAHLSTRARLDLFARVCAGVQHAHQKGVIHRDIKPSNVLVAEQDGRPVPKVIDFGTATLADRPLAGRMGLTEAGTVVGTLEYMSPEQAALSTDIDTASDVYSLGVLLYELLVGDLPFDRDRLRMAGYDEMRRVILESDPPRPSERIRNGAHTANATTDSRGIESGRLARELAGDLDWIVLRALEKDRRRRYSTVAAFATDIERFLTDQPIDARPPSAAYRVGKFARRHRGAVAAAAALLVVLVAGFLTSTALYFRAERARAEADRQRLDADAQRATASAQRGVAEGAAAEATAERNNAIAANAESDRLRELAMQQVVAVNAALREAKYSTYVATINAADGLLRANAPTDARERLLTVPQAQRGWEWHHLFLRADSSLTTLKSSTTPCNPPAYEIGESQAFAASDNVLVLSGQGRQIFLRRCGTLDVWDIAGLAHSTIDGPRNRAILAVNATGLMLVNENRIYRYGQDRKPPQISTTLALIGRDSARPLMTFGPYDAMPNCADVSPDGLRVAVGFQPVRSPTGWPQDDVFEIWNAETGKLVARVVPALPDLPDIRKSYLTPCMVRFSPDGSMLATSGATVHVWRAESGAEIPSNAAQSGYVSQPIAFSPDATRLAIGRASGLVDVLNLTQPAAPVIHLDGNGLVTPNPLPDSQRRLISMVQAHKTAEVLSVTFSPDGTHIVSGTNRTVGIWDLASARLVTVREGHDAEVIGVSVSPDGRIFSADTAGNMRVWDWSADVTVGVTRLAGMSAYDPTHGLTVSTDGTAVGTLDIDGQLAAWRFADMRKTVIRAAGVRPSVPFAMSPDGRFLFAAERDAVGTLRKWTVGSSESVALPMLTTVDVACNSFPNAVEPRPNRYLERMALSPDGRLVAYVASAQSRCLVIRDLETLETLGTLTPGMFAFRPDGTLLVAANGYTTTVRRWDWRPTRTLATVVLPLPRIDATTEGVGWGLIVSPDGSRIALMSIPVGIVSIWDGDLTRELGRLPAHDITRLAFSSDGRRIVTANKDTAVRIWDGERFQLVLTLTDTDGHLGGVAFTKDGRVIAGRTSGGLTIWESTKAPCAVCEAKRIADERARQALETRLRADRHVLESADCSALERDVPPQPEREFALNPRRACWTPWLVLAESGDFDLKESGNLLVQLGFRDGTVGDPFEDGPAMTFNPGKPVQKIRFKSLGKAPVTVTFKVR